MGLGTILRRMDLEQQRTKVIADYLAASKQLRDEFDARLADLDERLAEARQKESQEQADPDVLVRMSLGAKRKVYHSAEHPCGRVDRGGGFKRMKESEARVYDANVGITLVRCAACWAD